MKNPKKTDIVIDSAAIEEAMMNVAKRKGAMLITEPLAEDNNPGIQRDLSKGYVHIKVNSKTDILRDDFPIISKAKHDILVDKAIELIEGKK